ncbi:6-hydroxynicotinate reductase [Granulosicoccus antarcticus]|uniref:6-hydroxynicotinate reductase n=1 Tax=Granulosicoccus antarcticus IMCC3135 TaxID=1192854 RepID=A0A2Z2NRJ9_9GAMM|nr:6-hydroxynicotinate reductase [Granulosicoccus antarcticus]ASJ71370.1 6-hydroxynicotinate reductase [Granulosicoccus antarcticus IMCC3135]
MVRFAVDQEENGKIRCDACPVLCYIKDGRTGACDRYANEGGELVRVDAFTILQRADKSEVMAVPFLLRPETAGVVDDGEEAGGMAAPVEVESLSDEETAEKGLPAWNGDIFGENRTFVTAIGAGTTYPDYKPAPFIVSQQYDDVDMVTVVTEGIFSYCGVKVKIDTDRHIGPEQATVRVQGEAVGHVMTGEYGSQMLSLGGVNHLTGGSKKEGRITCNALLQLCNCEAVDMSIDGGAELTVQAGAAPIVNGVREALMRVGCGSATIGMFARQWEPHVDEVVVVDDHITGVLSEHQAGKLLGMKPTGLRIRGRRSTPGRYFQVAEPGSGWGGTDIQDPLSILDDFKPAIAWPGMRLLMVSTTGEQWAYFTLDEMLHPVAADLPEPLRLSVERIAENCEPSLCSVLFMGGAGGSLRAGVTENPVGLTRSVRESLTYVSCAGAPAYVWPGGGITIMADVTQMPRNAFGYVPTPALVAPIEFTMRRSDYERLGGHMEQIRTLQDIAQQVERRVVVGDSPGWPGNTRHFSWR